ncbi:tol-pal system YbgF family protein [Actinomadura chokoriensis]|uniref:Tetratricopeptide repeat protein n=1 Tax=Actinomadura chokoriensis TaxID=454156 RepID=A0ABV4QY86_9ACTN
MDERVTCVGFMVGGWERLNVAERIRARLDAAEQVAGSGRGRPQVMLAAGDVSVFVFRAEPVEAVVTLVNALRQGAGRQGTRISVTGGSSGPRTAAEAVAEAVRLLLRGPRCAALCTVLLNDLLHWHVRSAPAMPRFERIREDLFGPDHWVWPADVPAAGPGHACLPARPGPDALLALGKGHLELGERRAALEAWRYLLRRHPLTLAAYPLMDLEEQDDVARGYLTDGLRIVRARPELAAEPARLEHELLCALAARAYRTGERRAGDRLVNEAAAAYRDGAAPLRVLAREALRRGDRDGARRLLAAALARAEDVT